MFIGFEHNFATGRDDAAQKLLHLFFRRPRVGTTESFFQDNPFLLLFRAHSAASAQFCIIKPVDKERLAYHEIEIHGPILAVLEGPESVQN